jgi:hypothetical protein
MDVAFFMRPAILLASVLDPLNWKKNAAGMYFVPVNDLLSEDEQDVCMNALADFCDGDDEETRKENARVEFGRLKCKTFRGAEVCTLDTLTTKVVEVVENREVLKVAPHDERMGFFLNILGELHGCARACMVYLCMPVTSCSAERNWSKWGNSFVPNRNKLGLEVAKDMIYVQQNDPLTRLPRGGLETFVE